MRNEKETFNFLEEVGYHRNTVDDILTFLEENYVIHINELNPKQLRIESKIKEYSHPVTIDDIIIHLEQEQIDFKETLLKKILQSPNQLPVYNPIADYFTSLAYQGKSHIDILCGHLKAVDYGDKEKGYYQHRLNRLLKKWLAACVACSLGDIPNEVALGLVQSKEGTGKTFLAKFLMPDKLNALFCTSQADTQKFNIEHEIVKRFMILYDECIGMNDRQAETFKKALSTDKVNMGISFEYVRKRISNIIFTSNNRTGKYNGFLTSALGYRRFAVLHLEEIDQSYLEKVDVHQIWAEAYMLYKGDFNYRFNITDFEEFKAFNQRFKIETIAHSLIEHYFEIPLSEKEGEWWQPKEIVEYLKSMKVIRTEHIFDMTPKKIGEALTQLGFKREMNRKGRNGNNNPAYRYCAQIITHDTHDK